MAEFKRIIKELRKEFDMTQTDLANALQMSKSTIAMWETGKRLPSTEVYEIIADYFNVDMDFLYGKQPVKRKITIGEIEEHAELMAAYTFNSEVKPYLKMLMEMSPEYRHICFNSIQSIYDAYKNISDL